jgi:hypothetical protein
MGALPSKDLFDCGAQRPAPASDVASGTTEAVASATPAAGGKKNKPFTLPSPALPFAPDSFHQASWGCCRARYAPSAHSWRATGDSIGEGEQGCKPLKRVPSHSMVYVDGAAADLPEEASRGHFPALGEARGESPSVVSSDSDYNSSGEWLEEVGTPEGTHILRGALAVQRAGGEGGDVDWRGEGGRDVDWRQLGLHRGSVLGYLREENASLTAAGMEGTVV